jgi:hypothetical protein
MARKQTLACRARKRHGLGHLKGNDCRRSDTSTGATSPRGVVGRRGHGPLARRWALSAGFPSGKITSPRVKRRRLQCAACPPAVVDHSPALHGLWDNGFARPGPGHGHLLIVEHGCPWATSAASSRNRRVRPGLVGDRSTRARRSIWSLDCRVSEKEREQVAAQGSSPNDCSAGRWSVVGRLPRLPARSRFHAHWHKHPRLAHERWLSASGRITLGVAVPHLVDVCSPRGSGHERS